MSEIHGEVHWNELMTHDVGKAKEFYTETCGWSWDTMPMETGHYHIAKRGEEMVGGMMDISEFPDMKEMPATWVTYIAVDDVDSAAKRTSEMGGQIMKEAFDVPGVGRIVMAIDPTGAMIGLMTPASQD